MAADLMHETGGILVVVGRVPVLSPKRTTCLFVQSLDDIAVSAVLGTPSCRVEHGASFSYLWGRRQPDEVCRGEPALP